MPFLNPAEFVKNIEFKQPSAVSDFTVEWLQGNSNELEKVKVKINDNLIAELKPGFKPGWSANVKKDGPLAQILSDEY